MKTIFLTLLLLSSICLSSQTTTSMKDWNYPYEVKEAKIDEQTTIGYIDEGEGEETLLFIHGLGSYLRAWQKNVDSLKHHYRCIALDLPGYGKSVEASGPQTMRFFAEVVSAFVRQLELTNVTLVGHSMGGQIAIHTVLRDTTSQVKRLVLAAPAGFETFTIKDKSFLTTVYNAAFIKATSDEQIKKNFQINFFNMPEDAQFMIEDRLSMKATQEYNRYCEMIPKCVAGMLEEPVFDELHKIKLPTLVIFGNNDYLIPNTYLHPDLTTEKVANQGIAEIKQAKLLMMDNAGHFVQWEAAAAFNEAIITFIAEK